MNQPLSFEAGFRSRDWSMPEEINRLLTEALSDVLFVTEQDAVRNLRSEGIPPQPYPPNRMLKKSASGILASLRGSTYRSVRLASSLAAALLDGLFEHPAATLT